MIVKYVSDLKRVVGSSAILSLLSSPAMLFFFAIHFSLNSVLTSSLEQFSLINDLTSTFRISKASSLLISTNLFLPTSINCFAKALQVVWWHEDNFCTNSIRKTEEYFVIKTESPIASALTFPLYSVDSPESSVAIIVNNCMNCMLTACTSCIRKSFQTVDSYWYFWCFLRVCRRGKLDVRNAYNLKAVPKNNCTSQFTDIASIVAKFKTWAQQLGESFFIWVWRPLLIQSMPVIDRVWNQCFAFLVPLKSSQQMWQHFFKVPQPVVVRGPNVSIRTY